MNSASIRIKEIGKPELKQSLAPVQLGAVVIPELTPLNFFFFWVVANFKPVKVFGFNSKCRNWPLGRMQELNLVDYIDPDEVQKLRDEICERWNHVSKKLFDKPTGICEQGRLVDISVRMNQFLALHFERFFMFSAVLEKLPIDSVEIRCRTFTRLRKWVPQLPPQSQKETWLSFINVFLDDIYEFLMIFFKGGLMCLGLVRALFYKRSNPKTFSILWDAVNTNEYSFSKDHLNFSWIVDGKAIHKENIFFLLPVRLPHGLREEVLRNGLFAETLNDAYRLVSRSHLLKTIINVFGVFVRMFSVPFHQTNFALEWLRYQPIVQGFKPTSYVECVSQLGHEMAQVAVMNALGIKTVMYFYSANGYLWRSSESESCRFRCVMFADIAAQYAFPWHQSYVDYLNEHHQKGCRIEAVGSLMAGDESVMNENRNALREKFQVPISEKVKVLSIFDVSPIRKNNRISDFYPVYYDENYIAAFLKDAIELMHAFPNLYFIYKPKRNIMNQRFSYSPAFHEALNRFVKSGRAILLSDTVNPWIPIALADICVGLPFTSPVIAAVRYKKAGIYHDPTGVTNQHRYSSIQASISHNYDDLCLKIHQELSLLEHIDHARTEWNSLIGPSYSVSATDHFRQWLSQEEIKH